MRLVGLWAACVLFTFRLQRCLGLRSSLRRGGNPGHVAQQHESAPRVAALCLQRSSSPLHLHRVVSVPVARRGSTTNFRQHCTTRERRTRCQAEDLPSSRESRLTYLFVAAIVLPLLAGSVFSPLLAMITDFALTAKERQGAILVLLLSKRICLYSTAVVALDWCSNRAALAPDVPLGERFISLNREMFGTKFSDAETEAARPLYDALDRVEGNTLALALPVLLAGSLLASFAFLAVSSSVTDPPSNIAVSALGASVSLAANGAVSFFFAKAEFQALRRGFSPQLPPEAATVAAAALSFIALLSPVGAAWAWPAQNFLNVLIAVTVSRAIFLTDIRAALVAILGITAYDYVGTVGSTLYTDNGQSIMEAVAVAKAGLADAATSAGGVLESGAAKASFETAAWRPGLFSVVLNGRVSDALGLGDVVFPAILGGWSLREDLKGSKGGKTPLYNAVLAGYVVGCIVSEVFQTTGAGQAELLYLTPAMLIALLVAWLFRMRERG